MVAGGQHLVTDGDEGNVAGLVVRQHVRVHPLSRRVGIGGQARNVAVRGADDDSDAGIGQGFDDPGIGAVETDFSDGG